MSDTDPNVWYQLTESRVDFNSSLQYNGKDIFFALANQKAQQYWQFFPVDNGNYQLRNRATDTKQLGTCYKPQENGDSKTQPCMVNPIDGERSQKWIVDQWDDGTWRFVNVGNGTNYNMDVHPGNPPFMSGVIAKLPRQPAQHWMWQSMMPIDDGAYSTAFGKVGGTYARSDTLPLTFKRPPPQPHLHLLPLLLLQQLHQQQQLQQRHRQLQQIPQTQRNQPPVLARHKPHHLPQHQYLNHHTRRTA
jgi:hypothetical protein